MAKRVNTEKDLADALKNGEDTIEIEGDLAKKTVKIKATGNVAWAVAIGAIGIATYSTVATIGTGGASTPVTGTAVFFTAPAAVGILGGAATWTAISIAVAAGGIGALNTLRKYKQASYEDGVLILKRK